MHARSTVPLDTRRYRMEDEQLSYHADRERFDQPRHRDINAAQTFTASGCPFLLEAAVRSSAGQRSRAPTRELAVVLVHGLSASPAQMRGLGEVLSSHGFPVYGVRLKGHGTSPWDLHERQWEDWLTSVRTGLEVAGTLAPKVALVGFSTGAALSLCLAAEPNCVVTCVVGICTPDQFQDKRMQFLSFVHGADRLVSRAFQVDAMLPFVSNASGSADFSYAHMPISSLSESLDLVEALQARSAQVRCPVQLIQSAGDPVIEPSSMERIAQRLLGTQVTTALIESKEHDLVALGEPRTREAVLDFLIAQSA